KVTNSTFSANTADDGGRGIVSLGDSDGASARAAIINTIIGQGDASVTDLVVNQINGGSAPVNRGRKPIPQKAVLNGATNTLTNTLDADPLLTALSSNGGPTQTMALLADSPAIDASTAIAAPATDQRGVYRDRFVDIGAYEDRLVADMIVNTE